MKTNPIFFALTFSLVSSATWAASKNLCDDLADSGATKEQIQKCWDNPKYGKSDYAKEKEVADSLKKQASEKKTEETTKKKDNIEFKKFTEADLMEAGFGKPFFAIRGDYRYNTYKEKRLTEGDALCKYLGYEKAVKSIVSPNMYADKAGNSLTDKQGLIVDTNFLGRASSEAELYRDEDKVFTVRKYVEISCARRVDKNIDTNNEILKSVTEDLIVLNENFNSNKEDRKQGVDDSGRTNKQKSSSDSSFGYKKPDWATDPNQASGSTAK